MNGIEKGMFVVATEGGRVFRIHVSRIAPVKRDIGIVPDGSIPPEHPGIAWLFEDAARMADRLSFCGEYDRMCDALGIPGRVRKFNVELVNADGIKITASVEARSRRLAEQRVRERLAGTAPLELEQVSA